MAAMACRYPREPVIQFYMGYLCEEQKLTIKGEERVHRHASGAHPAAYLTTLTDNDAVTITSSV